MKKSLTMTMILLFALCLSGGMIFGCGGGDSGGGGDDTVVYTTTGVYDFPTALGGATPMFSEDCDDDNIYDACYFDELDVRIDHTDVPVKCNPPFGYGIFCIQQLQSTYLTTYYDPEDPTNDLCESDEWDRPKGGAAGDIVGTWWINGKTKITFNPDNTFVMKTTSKCQ